MNDKKYILTKSAYVRGLQCVKSLYLNKHFKHLATPFSKERLASFEQGRMFEKKFKALFRNAIDIDKELGNKINQYQVYTEKNIPIQFKGFLCFKAFPNL